MSSTTRNTSVIDTRFTDVLDRETILSKRAERKALRRERAQARSQKKDKRSIEQKSTALVPYNDQVNALSSLDPDIAELLGMLTYKRPSFSVTEERFIKRWIDPLPDNIRDDFGNYWVQVGDPSVPIIWSCHLDTVHNKEGIQKVSIGQGIVTSDSNCLGADCTAGVWIMINMIRAKVAGTYIFHRSEECGAIGSNWIKRNCNDILDKYKFAIAFDRRGFNDVITHQGSRTASNAFAKSMTDILNAGDATFKYAPSDRGLFTDTKTYSTIIPECSNISVGYNGEHTSSELLNSGFLQRLLKVMISSDWTKLVCERDPDEIPEYSDSGWGYGYSKYSSSRYRHDGASSFISDKAEDDDTIMARYERESWRRPGSTYCPINNVASGSYYGKSKGKHYAKDIEEFIFNNPSETAEFLTHLGFTLKDLEDFMDEL